MSDEPSALELVHASEAGLARFEGRVVLHGRYVFCRYADTDFSARFVPDARSRRMLPRPIEGAAVEAIYPSDLAAFFAQVFGGRSVEEVWGSSHRAARGHARVDLADFTIAAECGGWTYGATFTQVERHSLADGEDDDDEDGCLP